MNLYTKTETTDFRTAYRLAKDTDIFDKEIITAESTEDLISKLGELEGLGSNFSKYVEHVKNSNLICSRSKDRYFYLGTDLDELVTFCTNIEDKSNTIDIGNAGYKTLLAENEKIIKVNSYRDKESYLYDKYLISIKYGSQIESVKILTKGQINKYISAKECLKERRDRQAQEDKEIKDLQDLVRKISNALTRAIVSPLLIKHGIVPLDKFFSVHSNIEYIVKLIDYYKETNKNVPKNIIKDIISIGTHSNAKIIKREIPNSNIPGNTLEKINKIIKELEEQQQPTILKKKA